MTITLISYFVVGIVMGSAYAGHKESKGIQGTFKMFLSFVFFWPILVLIIVPYSLAYWLSNKGQ